MVQRQSEAWGVGLKGEARVKDVVIFRQVEWDAFHYLSAFGTQLRSLSLPLRGARAVG